MGLFGVTASSEFGGSDMTYLDQVGTYLPTYLPTSIRLLSSYIRKAAWADLDQDGITFVNPNEPLPNNIESVKMFLGNYLFKVRAIDVPQPPITFCSPLSAWWLKR